MPLMSIYGISFECPNPYTEGHVISEIEAAELNRARQENIRNNLSKQAKGRGNASEAAKAELSSRFAAYAASYVFTRRATAEKLSATEREALRIAKATLREALQRKGEQRSEEDFNELASQIAQNPAVVAEAERRVSRTRDIASAALGDELL